jgi:hypothetical protein
VKRRSRRSAAAKASQTKAELAAELAALRKRQAWLERRAPPRCRQRCAIAKNAAPALWHRGSSGSQRLSTGVPSSRAPPAGATAASAAPDTLCVGYVLGHRYDLNHGPWHGPKAGNQPMDFERLLDLSIPRTPGSL